MASGCVPFIVVEQTISSADDVRTTRPRLAAPPRMNKRSASAEASSANKRQKPTGTATQSTSNKGGDNEASKQVEQRPLTAGQEHSKAASGQTVTPTVINKKIKQAKITSSPQRPSQPAKTGAHTENNNATCHCYHRHCDHQASRGNEKEG